MCHGVFLFFRYFLKFVFLTKFLRKNSGMSSSAKWHWTIQFTAKGKNNANSNILLQLQRGKQQAPDLPLITLAWCTTTNSDWGGQKSHIWNYLTTQVCGCPCEQVGVSVERSCWTRFSMVQTTMIINPSHEGDRNTHLFCWAFKEVGQQLLLSDRVVHFHCLLGNLGTKVIL